MLNLSNIGRIFFGVAMAAMGLETIYYRDFPYMLIPPEHAWLKDHLIFVLGAFFFLAGAYSVVGKKMGPVALLLGGLLVAIFCLYIPTSFHYTQLGQWENVAKELALAAGALVISGWDSARRVGTILFCAIILFFGLNHFVYATEASGYIPSWIPAHLFWMYVTGSALIGASLAILLNIKPRLAATLLGAMIFTWVVILHIPKAVGAPMADNEGEITSAFLALAYCGIAFAIAAYPCRPTKSL